MERLPDSVPENRGAPRPILTWAPLLVYTLAVLVAASRDSSPSTKSFAVIGFAYFAGLTWFSSRSPRRRLGGLRRFGRLAVYSVLILCGLAVTIYPYCFAAYSVPSWAMEPTILGHNKGDLGAGRVYQEDAHDRIAAFKWAYRLSGPQFGDIVVFRAEKKADMSGGQKSELIQVKRIIGLPGDRVIVKPDAEGKVRVWRNGKPLDEPYLLEEMAPPHDMQEYGIRSELKLGPDEVFVLGDNRNFSNDSRFWGPLPVGRIIGKVISAIDDNGRLREVH